MPRRDPAEWAESINAAQYVDDDTGWQTHKIAALIHEAQEDGAKAERDHMAEKARSDIRRLREQIDRERSRREEIDRSRERQEARARVIDHPMLWLLRLLDENDRIRAGDITMHPSRDAPTRLLDGHPMIGKPGTKYFYRAFSMSDVIRAEKAEADRDEARELVRDLIVGECNVDRRWCLTHSTNDCDQRRAVEAVKRWDAEKEGE